MRSPARVCGEVPARVCGDGGRGVDLVWKIFRERASARRKNVVRHKAGAFKIAGDATVIDDHHCADSRDQDSQQKFGEEVEEAMEAMKGSQQKIHKEPTTNCGQLERGLVATTDRERRRGRLR